MTVPTCTLRGCVLVLVQGAPTSIYISLSPESTMAYEFSDTGVVVGDGGTVVMGNSGVGLKLVVVLTKVKLFSTTVPHHHIPASHSRLMSSPGPAGLALVAALMWP